MSEESYLDKISGKRTKLEDNYGKITSFDATCRNSIIDCFKNKCIEFYTEHLDIKSVRAYKNFNSTGKTVLLIFYYLSICSFFRFNVSISMII